MKKLGKAPLEEVKNGKVTCVLPNYNHADFLKESLGNILNQTRATDKLIVIDDASTDNSLKKIYELTLNSKQTQIIKHKKNIGCIATLNEGLYLSNTEFIIFSGADDRLNTDYIEKYLDFIQKWPKAAFCAGTSNIFNSASKIIGSRPLFIPANEPRFIGPKEVRELLEKFDNFFLAQTALYRRKYLLELGGFNPELNFFSDGMLMRHLALEYGFCFMPESLVSWRYTGNNHSVKNIVNPFYLNDLIKKTSIYISNQRKDLFPKNYTDLLERRLRFGSVRLQITMLNSVKEEDINNYFKILNHPLSKKFFYKLLPNIPKTISQVFLTLYAISFLKPYNISFLIKAFLKRSIKKEKKFSKDSAKCL